MENKTSLPLMELLMMTLIFALAAALCLGAFAKAQQISVQTAHRETAALLAQNGAELLKSGGDLDQLLLPEGYTVTYEPEEGLLPEGLSLGEVQVCHEGELLFALPAAWQEVAP